MKEKNVIFSKEIGVQYLTKEIELIHQLGFFVEVESLDGFKGIANRSYKIHAIKWESVKELEQ